MAVEVRQLQAFLGVVDEGTFTDAAIALGTTQASVSRLVAALERALGVRVLQRTPRGAAPTAAGRRIAEHARRALREVETLTRVAAGAADVPAEVRLGYAWAALGRHTVPLQRRWSAAHPASALVLVQAATTTAGLLEGVADIAVTRRPLDGRRFATAVVGTEDRYATVASGHRLARRRTVRVGDFAGTTVAVDARTGTTSEDLWPPGSAPAATRDTHHVDEWLSLIAAGQAVGITSEATTWQHRRPGLVFRRVVDAEPVPVRLAWWRDAEPACAAELVRWARDLYGTGG